MKLFNVENSDNDDDIIDCIHQRRNIGILPYLSEQTDEFSRNEANFLKPLPSVKS